VFSSGQTSAHTWSTGLCWIWSAHLTDVTIAEQWLWAYMLDGYIFKVEGTAVGKKERGIG